MLRYMDRYRIDIISIEANRGDLSASSSRALAIGNERRKGEDASLGAIGGEVGSVVQKKI